MKLYDILIVGGGPIGIACALEAKKNNLSHIIVEKGCIANSLFNYPLNMQFFSTSEKLEIDNIPFISNENKPRRNEALEYYRRIVTSNELTIKLFEKVNNIASNSEYFKVITNKTSYKAKHIVIASGFYDIPKMLNVPGENLTKVSHYYKDSHFYANQELVIVGASNSAVDAALECYRKGAKVTMIVRGPEIGKRVKYWVRPDVINRIEEGGIKAYFNSTVKNIKNNTLSIDTSEGEITIDNDFVLALTGYNPNFDFLRQLGITLSDDEKSVPQYNTKTMETNVDNLYLAGVICGGTETHKWFIENSRIHAKLIINNILKKVIHV